MTYLKYATGFKGGGFSPRPANPLQTVPFEAEKLKTAELGAKSELLERTMRLNGAVFYSKYTNQQTFAQQFDSSGANWFREMNAGESTMWGFEAELQAEPIDSLRIDGSIGYLDYELDDNEGNVLLFEGDECGGSRCYSPRTPEVERRAGRAVRFRRRRRHAHAARGRAVHLADLFRHQQRLLRAIQRRRQHGRLRQWRAGGLYARERSPDMDVGRPPVGAGRLREQPHDEAYFNGKLSLITFFGREQGNPGAPRTYGFVFKRSF